MDIRSHSLDEIWQVINQGALVVDVRTEQEFAEGHLENALHIPHDQIIKHLDQLRSKSSAGIVLYCKSGGRSDFAMKLLKSENFEQLYNAGGYQSLISAKP